MKKKILIFNRRDVKNPASGGAEIYTHEIFRRLTCDLEITHFSCCYAKCRKEEYIDNIRYLRKGNELTTHWWGFLYALRNNTHFDIIIDEFNGIGFMTFCLKNSIMLIHQLYNEFWTAKIGSAGIIFRVLENWFLSRYKDKKVITVSESTKTDLLTFGFKAENISIVYNGINYVNHPPKEEFKPVVMFLGRLVKTKNPEDAVKAFLVAKESLQNFILYIAGDGDERSRLEKKHIHNHDIKFFGFVSEEDKYRLLREASMLIVPSIREGWGQVVIQANMVGTPVIGYRVQGLRDAVLEGMTGMLVPKGDVQDLAEAIVYLFKNRNFLKKMSDEAIKYSRRFQWEESAKAMGDLLRTLR